MLKHLRNKQPELKITDREIELIKIAGLCHDLGHGPFSHFFDNHFLNLLEIDLEHEVRSCMLLEHIVNKYKLEISSEELSIIFNMINPTEEYLKCERSFLYKIVNNKTNGIDVDKFDYIKRDSFFLGMSFGFDCSRIIKQSMVIDGDICFLDKTFYDIQELFEVRDKLHRRVYKHHTNTTLDLMVLDIFKDLMNQIDFKEFIIDPEKFYILDDHLIWRFDHPLVDMIKKRKFYKHIIDLTEEECKDKIDKIVREKGDNLILTDVNFGYSEKIFPNIYFYCFNQNKSKLKKEDKFNKIFRFNKKEKLIRIIKKF